MEGDRGKVFSDENVIYFLGIFGVLCGTFSYSASPEPLYLEAVHSPLLFTYVYYCCKYISTSNIFTYTYLYRIKIIPIATLYVMCCGRGVIFLKYSFVGWCSV